MTTKAVKPKVEDVIYEVLADDVHEMASDFVAFLRANKLTTPWSATNSWKIRFKGKDVGFLSTYGTAAYRGLTVNSWQICFTAHDFACDDTALGESCVLSDIQKNIVWSKLSNCQNHPYQCNPGKSMTILGKKIENVCHQWLYLTNPDIESLDCAKKLILLFVNSVSNRR